MCGWGVVRVYVSILHANGGGGGGGERERFEKGKVWVLVNDS